MKGDSWTGSPGGTRKLRGFDLPAGPPPPVEVPTEPPTEPEELSRDDLDDGMDTVEQWTPPEGSGETVSSTEIGGQTILWKGRGTNNGQPALAEIPDEETFGSPQFETARLEGPLDDEEENIGANAHHNPSQPLNFLKTPSTLLQHP